jgi:hypothetical protein
MRLSRQWYLVEQVKKVFCPGRGDWPSFESSSKLHFTYKIFFNQCSRIIETILVVNFVLKGKNDHSKILIATTEISMQRRERTKITSSWKYLRCQHDSRRLTRKDHYREHLSDSHKEDLRSLNWSRVGESNYLLWQIEASTVRDPAKDNAFLEIK